MLNEAMTLKSWWFHDCVKLEPGEELRLWPEPENEHDEDAIALYKRTQKVAYVPRDKTRLIHEAWKKHAWVTATVQYEGDEELGFSPTIVVQDIEGYQAAKEEAARKDSEFRLKAVGCCGALVLAFAVIMALIAIFL